MGTQQVPSFQDQILNKGVGTKAPNVTTTEIKTSVGKAMRRATYKAITDAEAAEEVKFWRIDNVKLAPALVTHKDLWETYKSQDKDWGSAILKTSAKAAQIALSAPGVIDIINSTLTTFTSEQLAEYAIGAAQDQVIEKATDAGAQRVVGDGRPKVAGAYISSKEHYKMLKDGANVELASGVTGAFVTIAVPLLTVGVVGATAGIGALASAAVAIVIWLGKLEKAKVVKMEKEIVESMMDKYKNIRENALYKKTMRDRVEKERMVKSNGYFDWQDVSDNKPKYRIGDVLISTNDLQSMCAQLQRSQHDMVSGWKSKKEECYLYYNFKEAFDYAKDHSTFADLAEERIKVTEEIRLYIESNVIADEAKAR